MSSTVVTPRDNPPNSKDHEEYVPYLRTPRKTRNGQPHEPNDIENNISNHNQPPTHARPPPHPPNDPPQQRRVTRQAITSSKIRSEGDGYNSTTSSLATALQSDMGRVHDVVEEDGVKNIYIYRNGDMFNRKRRITWNVKQLRTWDAFLDELTVKFQNSTSTLTRIGAIRNIHTPIGGRRITKFEDMKPDGEYVAVSTGERLKHMDYMHKSRMMFGSKNIRHYRLDPIVPVLHSKLQVNSRFIQTMTMKKKLVIKVYRNGDQYTPAVGVQFTHLQLLNMDRMLKTIGEKVILPNNKPIRRLYTMEGYQVVHPRDIQENNVYVAAYNEPYHPLQYGQRIRKLVMGKVRRSKYVDGKWENIRFLDNPVTPEENRIRPNPPPLFNGSPRALPSLSYRGGQSHGFPSSRLSGVVHRNNLPRESSYSPLEEPQSWANKHSRVPAIPSHKPSDKSKSTEEDEAATIIQAYMKGYQKRKEVDQRRRSNTMKKRGDTKQKPTTKDDEAADEDMVKAATIIQAGVKGYQTRKRIAGGETQEEQRYIKKKEDAAVKIQASYRGYKTRKEVVNDQKSGKATKEEKQVSEEEAATFIQANFKGYKTRKEIGAKVTKNETSDKVDDNDDRNRAAIKIQSNFRGYKERKNIKNKECNDSEDQ